MNPGLLSGKYFGNGTGRLHSNKMYEARYGDKWMFEVAEKYVGFCKAKGLHPVTTAIAWVAAHPGITAPIIGSRSVEQLQASLDSVKIDMTPELYKAIAALSRTPAPATPIHRFFWGSLLWQTARCAGPTSGPTRRNRS